ncbi:SDR family oxidoreductase [Kibdelosporangium phytohabitans]|uniref:Short-chain dehydrogenase n=1 Tax=Kibdelosporangium phytohabitans TaxID=860235 RepID=A0A0N9IDB1_9PSEU|nr:SDR family oxidoreductase [Kibdelosporangium phytohabitans]ALG12653.1 short-chain dehydrogenase [Kibdelosporangium phytohabitans]MBE1464301.1 NAD(P)-dependent dehydrogenase (short-subunit alcohol dehydrogenase family) [Kibdelosporangium phytohabitans]
MELALDGSVVLVTGGARGVGLGVTRAFQSAGATVVICGRTQPDEPVADFLVCDIRDVEQIDAMVATIVDRYGRLDVLVNNAGGAPVADTSAASPRFHEAVIRLNLLAPLLVSQRANTVMQQQDSGGSIVMISSINGSRPAPQSVAYGAAKAGVNNSAASLAAEWAPKVRVNSLGVGMVRTEITEEAFADVLTDAAAAVPLGRLAEPSEVGACAVFLASPLASYVTGATLLVHGGGELPVYFKRETP